MHISCVNFRVAGAPRAKKLENVVIRDTDADWMAAADNDVRAPRVCCRARAHCIACARVHASKRVFLRVSTMVVLQAERLAPDALARVWS
jgi:hypothetical protein